MFIFVFKSNTKLSCFSRILSLQANSRFSSFLVIAYVIIPAALVSTLSEINTCSLFWDKKS